MHKKEENTVAVLAYMDSKKNDVCEALDKLLEAVKDDEKIAKTPLSQIATTIGILIDKFTAAEQPLPQTDNRNSLLDAIVSSTKEDIRTDDIPELQQTAEYSADMVESPDVFSV